MRAPFFIVSLLLVVILAGCQNSSDIRVANSSSETDETGTNATAVPPIDPNTIPEFQDQMTLLPFSQRIYRMAQQLEVAESNSIFETLLENRYRLGDYDYSTGIQPSLGLDSEKVALWLESLIPVCESAAFEQRYDFPEDIPTFIEESYGRTPRAGEVTQMTDAYQTAASPTLANQRLCLQVFASTEYLLQ